MMMRAENFFILRRKPVEVRPVLWFFVIPRVLFVGGPSVFDFCSIGGGSPGLALPGKLLCYTLGL